jgi:hypothetical protein
MPIGEFIGTFETYGHIPGLFERIMSDSNKIVISRFRLRADEGADGKIDGTQYYGLRCNPAHEKNSILNPINERKELMALTMEQLVYSRR